MSHSRLSMHLSPYNAWKTHLLEEKLQILDCVNNLGTHHVVNFVQIRPNHQLQNKLLVWNTKGCVSKHAKKERE